MYFVCPNGRTDRAKILCETSHDPKEGLWMLKITNIFFFDFCKIKNAPKILLNPRSYLFVIVVQREDARR